MKHTPIPYERQEIIRRERELAKYANTMDSLFYIPFTLSIFSCNRAAVL